MGHRRHKPAAAAAACVILAAALLAGCETYTQTTSGAGYLEGYGTGPAAEPMTDVDRRVRQAASVEPLLRFPARLGLARIDRGRLTAVPPAEADAWLAAVKKLGPDFGEFVSISPMIVSLAAGDLAGEKRACHSRHGSCADGLVQRVRLGAARQHVDAVLIYEVFGCAESKRNPLAVADVTVLGLFLLPSRAVQARGYASALLMDVRNGYPYGVAQAQAEESDLATWAGSDESEADSLAAAKSAAAVKLVPVVETMMARLAAVHAARANGPAARSAAE